MVIDEVQKVPALLDVVHALAAGQLEPAGRAAGGEELFARFALNLTAVARECGVSRKTVEGYLEILEDLLLAFRVPVFQRRAQRQLVAHAKFFYFDAGVSRSLRAMDPSRPLP